MRGFFVPLQQVDESIPHLFERIRSKTVRRYIDKILTEKAEKNADEVLGKQ